MFVITGGSLYRILFHIHFTITGPKNIVLYTGVFVVEAFIIGFHCNKTDKLSATGKGIP